MASVLEEKSKEVILEYEKGQDPESNALNARKIHQIGQIVLILNILAGIYFSIVYNFVIVYLLVVFFTLVLMKRPNLEKIEPEGLKAVLNYFMGFLKVGLVFSLIWLSAVLWVKLTPYLLIPLGIICYLAWRIIHFFTPIDSKH
ncbi:MAG: hypothetical protein K9W44_00935 [Candidatus Lokiarchaeota archaeon]|nr:hypothetical protein [Candidatus Harpocratesius repetitus]